MRIESGFVLPATPTPVAPPSAGGASFGDLMATRESLVDGSRAAGFQARGMFGRHGATAAMATTMVERRGEALEASEPPSPAPPGPGPILAPAKAARTSVSHDPQPGGPAAGAADRPPLSICATRLEDAGAAIGETLSGPEDAAPAEQPGFGATRRRGPPAPAPRQMMRVDLAKAGEPDAAALVVRAAGLDPREIAEFRVRAQILLRERGLALDKVRINGEDHPAVEAPGGGSQAWR